MPNICTIPPDFTLTNYHDNSSVSLSDYNGKVIILSFMSVLCGHCINWLQNLQQIHNDYDTNPNVQVLGVLFKSGGAVTTTDVQTMLSFTSVTVTFPLLMDSGTVKPQYMTGYVGPSIGYPFSYIISRAHLVANKWHRLSTPNGALVCFDSEDRNDTEYFVRHRIDDLLIDRPPWDTVLALDYSGSMTGSATVGSVTQPKIDFLREAASTLVKVWKDYALCQDRIGVVYFRCHATSSGNLVDILPGTNIQNLINDFQAENATGCTAMGAALATGLDILGSGTNKRFIILFTDGMQNRNPLVYVAQISGSPELRIDNITAADYPSPLTYLCSCPGDSGQSNYTGALPVILEGITVPIHAIGIGAPTGWQQMLQNISAATVPTGQFKTDVQIWPTLKEFFIETLVDIYRGNTLQVVTKNQSTLAGGEHTEVETFLLNKSVKKLTVLLSWVGEEVPLTFKLRKDGTTIDLRHKVVEDSTYRFSTIDFPHYQITRTKFLSYQTVSAKAKMAASAEMMALPHDIALRLTPWGAKELINPDGTWEVIIERTYPDDGTSVPYHLMVLADDKELEYDFEIPPKIYYTGEPIPVGVNVLENGKPLDKIFASEVVVSRPTVAVGTLLAKYKATGKRPNAESESSDAPSDPLSEKIDMLMRDKEVLASLTSVERERLNLRKVWKTQPRRRAGTVGRLQGSYDKTEVPGVYRFDFKVKGVGERCGVFERTETRTVLVQVKADWEATEVKSRYEKEKNRLSVSVVPTDKFGNLLGPGYADLLRFTVKNQPAGEVVDNLDGSYTIDVKLPKDTELNRLEAEFDVSGEKFFAGSLSKLVDSGKGGAKR